MKYVIACLIIVLMSGCGRNSQPWYINNLQKEIGTLSKKRQQQKQNVILIPIYKRKF